MSAVKLLLPHNSNINKPIMINLAAAPPLLN